MCVKNTEWNCDIVLTRQFTSQSKNVNKFWTNLPINKSDTLRTKISLHVLFKSCFVLFKIYMTHTLVVKFPTLIIRLINAIVTSCLEVRYETSIF